MKIYLLRHGQTYYNLKGREIRMQYGLIESNERLYDFIKYLNDDQLIDGELTPEGIEATLKNRKSESKNIEKIKAIIVSPLSRTL